MTRLHEALERAQAQASAPALSPAVPVDESQPEVPDDWRFDAGADADNVDVPTAATLTTGAGLAEHLRQQPFPEVKSANEYDFVTDWTADKVVVGPNVGHLFVEQYRRLAAALHHSQAQTGARTVMIASAVESEGKTLTAANVALTLSHSYQKRVLLVDADLRRPSQHELFQLSNQAGLGDVLMRGGSDTRLPVQRVSSHLWVMTAGHPNPDPMSGLISDEMQAFLNEAVRQFDWVVVDTPPVGLLTDANLLAAMVDLALLVVSAKSTPYPIVRKAIEALGVERVLGVVLNRADTRVATPGYYGYGYGYSYSYSYSNAPKPKGMARWLPFGKRQRRQT